jgi:solute carrier family 35 (GDP-fucose transporter), member C1
VLNTTTAPLFFLLTQLFIAVILFLGAHFLGFIEIPLHLDFATCKGLVPMVVLSVIGLRSAIHLSTPLPVLNLRFSFSNYTLKYVDASFYQVARGLVLPFTVLTSAVVLASRPSLKILFSCSIVTAGFFIGVFLDGIPVSLLGIFFGVLSSAITAMHAVVIKKSLEVVKGNALHLSWYTNLLSMGLLAPLVVIAGEMGEVWKLFGGNADYVPVEGEMTALSTFLWGSAITVGHNIISDVFQPWG